MALVITHSKVSGKANPSDTSLVGGADWDANHQLTGAASVAQGGTGATTPTAARANINQGLTPLTDAATIATDASLGNVFAVTLAGNRTLANPTNLADGATYQWLIFQDATGSRTLSFGSAFDFGAAGAPTLTTAANKLDIITATYDGTKLRTVFRGGFN